MALKHIFFIKERKIENSEKKTAFRQIVVTKVKSHLKNKDLLYKIVSKYSLGNWFASLRLHIKNVIKVQKPCGQKSPHVLNRVKY